MSTSTKVTGLPATVRDGKRRILSRCRREGLDIPSETADALESYFALLLRWNAKVNLTGLSTIEEAIDRLVLEPLIAASAISAEPGLLMDIGSGGGSPAIPLKIVRPSLSLWMVESKSRKAAFLRECVRVLALESTLVENARAEELLPRPELTESMDYVTVRAVRLDSRFLNTALAFVRPGGSLLLFGSRDGHATTLPSLSVVSQRELIGRAGSQLVVLQKHVDPSAGSPSNQ